MSRPAYLERRAMSRHPPGRAKNNYRPIILLISKKIKMSSTQAQTNIHFDWKKLTRVVQCVEFGSLAVKRYYIQVKVYTPEGYETLRWIECYSDNCDCPSHENRKTCIQRLGDWWWVPGYFTYELIAEKEGNGEEYDRYDRISGYCGPVSGFMYFPKEEVSAFPRSDAM